MKGTRFELVAALSLAGCCLKGMSFMSLTCWLIRIALRDAMERVVSTPCSASPCCAKRSNWRARARAGRCTIQQRQIELATTFADQAVIAIENVRLFEGRAEAHAELTESLEAADRDLGGAGASFRARPASLSRCSSHAGKRHACLRAKFGVLWQAEGQGLSIRRHPWNATGLTPAHGTEPVIYPGPEVHSLASL